MSSVDYETSWLQTTIDNLNRDSAALRTLVAQLDPLADSEDTYYAVSAGTDAAAAADAAVADITAHISEATNTAAGIYASVETLDDGC